MTRARRSSAGFTMVELLIAGLMSALVLLAVYFVFIANTTQYYRQEQIVQLQESMRFAIEMLKGDLRNAGRLAVVKGENPGRDPRLCTNRLGVRAVELDDEDDVPPIIQANGITPDRLRLLVDAGNGAMFSTRQISPEAVTLAPADQQPTIETRAIAASADRMRAHFVPGRYVSLSTPDNAFDMVPITEVAFAVDGTRLTLGESLCGDPRVLTCGQGCLAAAVAQIEYAIVANEEGDRSVTRLVRREVDVTRGDRDNPTYIAGTDLNMADYVVNFQAWGLTRDAASTTVAQERDLAEAREDRANGSVVFRDDIEDVRALGLLLAVRTPREDEEYVVAPDRELDDDQRLAADRQWFELDDELDGLARVQTLKVVVEATNLYRAELGVADVD